MWCIARVEGTEPAAKSQMGLGTTLSTAHVAAIAAERTKEKRDNLRRVHFHRPSLRQELPFEMDRGLSQLTMTRFYEPRVDAAAKPTAMLP